MLQTVSNRTNIIKGVFGRKEKEMEEEIKVGPNEAISVPLLQRVGSVECFQQEKGDVLSFISQILSVANDCLQQLPTYLISPVLRDKVNDLSKQVAELLYNTLSRLQKTDVQRDHSQKRFVDESAFPFYFSILLNVLNVVEELSYHPDIKSSTATQQTASSLLKTIISYLQKFEVPSHGQISQSVVTPEELVGQIKGVVSSKRDTVTEIYRFLKRRYIGIKPTKKQKVRDGSTESILKIMNILEDIYPSSKKSRKGPEDRLFELLARNNGQSLENQRYVMSEKKEMRMALNEVIRVVDKLGEGRMHDQSATSTKLSKTERVEQVEKIMDLVARSSSQFDDQRFVLSKEKVQKLSLNELVQSVERLTAQRMANQDAISPEEKKKEMMSVIVDVVEKMRASSMDDQRFIEKVAPRMRMTPKELNKSIESLSSNDTAALLGE